MYGSSTQSMKAEAFWNSSKVKSAHNYFNPYIVDREIVHIKGSFLIGIIVEN